MDHEDELHEINVTPFIDVMLVLLIIFMVAAPLSTVDVPVNLPAANAPPATRPPEPLYVTLAADLTLTVGQATVPRDELAARLRQLAAADEDQPLYLRADAAVAYGELMAVMNLLRAGGFTRVALVGLEAAP